MNFSTEIIAAYLCHCRPSTRVTTFAGHQEKIFGVQLYLRVNCAEVKATEIEDILELGIDAGTKVLVRAEGKHEQNIELAARTLAGILSDPQYAVSQSAKQPTQDQSARFTF